MQYRLIFIPIVVSVEVGWMYAPMILCADDLKNLKC